MSKVLRILVMSAVALVVAPVVLGRLFLAPVLRFTAFAAWQLTLGRRGVRALAVYSNSPRWQGHFETHVVSSLGKKAMVVNITSRSDWLSSKGIARKVHSTWGGGQNDTPIVIWFPRVLGRVEVVRFYEGYGRAAHRREDDQLLVAAVRRTQDLVNASA
jgi:hypothetical protein